MFVNQTTIGNVLLMRVLMDFSAIYPKGYGF